MPHDFSFRKWLATREEVTGSTMAVGTTGGATTTGDIANVKSPLFGRKPRRQKIVMPIAMRVAKKG